MENTELIERLARAESKIDNALVDIKLNRELAISTKEIATELKYMREEQNKMNDRLKKIEEKPLKDYEEAKNQIKKMVIAFFGGILLTALGLSLGLNKFM